MLIEVNRNKDKGALIKEALGVDKSGLCLVGIFGTIAHLQYGTQGKLIYTASIEDGCKSTDVAMDIVRWFHREDIFAEAAQIALADEEGPMGKSARMNFYLLDDYRVHERSPVEVSLLNIRETNDDYVIDQRKDLALVRDIAGELRADFGLYYKPIRDAGHQLELAL